MKQPSQSFLYAGIDGGGTRTRVLAVWADGSCAALALGNSSSINAAGREIAAVNLEATLFEAAEKAGSEPRFAAAFFGMAGVNDSTAAYLVGNLIREFPEVTVENFEVANDTRALHAATFGVDSGVVLIGGTGSKCYGRAADGREWEAGGVESLLGDEGSAYDLAIRGMKAAVRSMDGRGPKTMLEETLFRALRLSEYGEISQRLHQDSLENPGQPMTKTEIAAYARYVTEAWEAGDAVAKEIFETSMASAVELVAAVARKLEFSSATLRVGITGGALLNEPGNGVFRRKLAEALPGATVVVPEIPPVAGSALRALAMGGITLTPEVVENLKRTLPAGA